MNPLVSWALSRRHANAAPPGASGFHRAGRLAKDLAALCDMLARITPCGIDLKPKIADMEAPLTSRQGGIFEMILNDEPSATLDGLTRSVCGLVEILAKQCKTLVLKRRANPSLLVQPGHQ